MENWYPIFRTPLNFLQQMFGPIVKLLDCFRKQTDPKVRNPWVESRKNCLCDPLFNTILQERAESPLAVSQLSNGATINAAPLSVKTTRFPEKQFIIIEYSNYKNTLPTKVSRRSFTQVQLQNHVVLGNHTSLSHKNLFHDSFSRRKNIVFHFHRFHNCKYRSFLNRGSR